MEMGLSSLTEPTTGKGGGGGKGHHHDSSASVSVSASPAKSCTSSGSLNVLNLGKKVYYEDVGVLAKTSASGGGGGSSSSGQPKKGRGGVVQGSQPPRCQVEGCNVDLSDAKAYYSRHKVCSMHSKSPTVIVAGLEQRFCQQCSRFHQLPEFDQGKRSCRRRLAGHNERRRKPPSGSLLSSHFGRLPSSLFGTDGGSRDGGFLVDFSSYSRHSSRDAWPTRRSSDQVPEMQTTGTEKFLPHPWQSTSEYPPDFFLQNSASGARYPGPRIRSGECITGVMDSSCALSLLSNKPWESRNQASGFGISSFMIADGVPMAQPTAPLGATMTEYQNSTPWGFKSGEASSNLHAMPSDLGLGQISQPLNSQYSGDLELSRQGRRQFLEIEHSRAYNSNQQMHWSL